MLAFDIVFETHRQNQPTRRADHNPQRLNCTRRDYAKLRLKVLAVVTIVLILVIIQEYNIYMQLLKWLEDLPWLQSPCLHSALHHYLSPLWVWLHPS